LLLLFSECPVLIQLGKIMLGKITPMREGTAVGRLFGALRSNKQTQRAFVGQVVCGCLALFLLWGAWNNKCNMEGECVCEVDM
jgi:hypothetical protein